MPDVLFSPLFARTFLIVSVMLLITAVTARINTAFETATEMWVTIIASFIALFGVLFMAHSYPINLLLVGVFSGLMGWWIGPTIEYYGKFYHMRHFLKSKGITSTKQNPYHMTEADTAELERYIATVKKDKWNAVVSQALFATAIATAGTAGIVFMTDFDFGFLGGFLFIALLILIALGLLNIFFFKSSRFALIRAYFGVLIFTGYLLYDFNLLEKHAQDDTWGTAVSMAVSLYLDIINLFLDLLYILAATSD